jgi:SAM-dependent methyltransferase
MSQSANLSIVANNRRQIITLLRGQVSCPLLANLAELGWLDKMSEGTFSVEDFPGSAPRVAEAVFKYLAAIGLLISDCQIPGRFAPSELGRSVFPRFGSFCILNSYQEFFQNLGSLLVPNGCTDGPTVNRFRNVIGSGQLHAQKFFSRALEALKARSFPFVVDLGCGNGQFLQQVVEAQLTQKLGGVDASAIAVTATRSTIRATGHEGVHLCTVEADASQIGKWCDDLPWYQEPGLFSLWFVVHEFSRRDPQHVIRFLHEINRRYPAAELIVGELVRISPHALASNRMESIMPEFLFFHEISAQGVLSWPEWQEIRRAIPFRVVWEKQMDHVHVDDEDALPSNFIWHLKPN